MSHNRNACSVRTQTVAFLETGSSEMKFSLDKWTTQVFACPQSIVISWTMSKLSEVEIPYTTNCLPSSQVLIWCNKSVSNGFTLIGMFPEVRSPRESATSMLTTWSTCAMSGSTMQSQASQIGDLSSKLLVLEATNTSKSTLWAQSQTHITHCLHE